MTINKTVYNLTNVTKLDPRMSLSSCFSQKSLKKLTKIECAMKSGPIRRIYIKLIPLMFFNYNRLWIRSNKNNTFRGNF